MALLVLRPDERTPAPIPSGEMPALPPGTIVALPSSIWSMSEDFKFLAALASHNPWVPVVIIEDAATAPPGLGPEAIHLLAACCDVQRVVLSPSHPFEEQLSRELGVLIRQAIRLRSLPTEGEIVRYFGRCVPESARSDVARSVTGEAERPLSRRLVRAGLPAARDWRVGVRALRAVVHGIRDSHSEISAADFVGLHVKSLSRACRRHFGAPWRDLVGVGVWEGVAELFLRAHRLALGTTGRVRTNVG